jgi:hypothetical protein
MTLSKAEDDPDLILESPPQMGCVHFDITYTYTRQTADGVLRIEGKMLHPPPPQNSGLNPRPARDEGVIP